MLDTGSATITTECTCEHYDYNTDTYEPASVCYGDCSEWAWEDATSLIDSWAKHWDTNGIRIEAEGMGWTRASTYLEMSFEWAEQALRAFTIDGEFRVNLTVDDDGQLSVLRYSHDEPTGCRMVAVPISEWR